MLILPGRCAKVWQALKHAPNRIIFLQFFSNGIRAMPIPTAMSNVDYMKGTIYAQIVSK